LYTISCSVLSDLQKATGDAIKINLHVQLLPHTSQAGDHLMIMNELLLMMRFSKGSGDVFKIIPKF
jgi:hypothetical protein